MHGATVPDGRSVDVQIHYDFDGEAEVTETTILNIIKIRGSFQLNPFTYRSDKFKKLLKSMVAKGVIVRQRTKPGLNNYVLPE